jgi:hypothetical protein
MANTEHKEKLFQDFYFTAKATFEALESSYGITGVVSQIFGIDNTKQGAQEKLRGSSAWETLSALYEYAINGVCNDHPIDLVIGGSEVIKLATSENSWPSAEWSDIVSMGDGRFALDEGQSFAIYKLALLANVDIRTVRNAVSAGELITYKTDDAVSVDGASARKWLLGRRGFKQTINSGSGVQSSLESINTPGQFSDFLVEQRRRLGLAGEGAAKLVALHPKASSESLSELEAGVFSLPLDAAFPVADFYQLDRKQFLACVMRVFFYEELAALHSVMDEEGSGG